MKKNGRLKPLKSNRFRKAKPAAFFFILSCLLVTAFPAFCQTPEPTPKPTLLDLETTDNSFGGHFWNLYKQEEEPEFATWIGIRQEKIRKHRIKKITFKGKGNIFYGPKEEGDLGSHNSPYFRKRQEVIRIDTLPPKPDKHFAFRYEFNQKGQLTAADLPETDNRETMHVRRWYFPDGKLKESRYVSYDHDMNRRDTLVRFYQGFVLAYDGSGRKTEKLDYYQRIQSRYQSSYDNPNKKSGYYFETTRRLWQTKYDYDPEGKLLATRQYLLPDSGQVGHKALSRAEFYFYDKSGKLERRLAITEMHKPSRNQALGGSMEEMLYTYQGPNLQRSIKNEFSFMEALPDTLKAARGEIAVDSATLGSPYYILSGSENNPGPHPFISPFETPDTVYYLQPDETRGHYRNYYYRQDEMGRLDLVYNFEQGAQKRRFGKRLVEAWTDKGLGGYDCRFIWLNRKQQPIREVWIERYNSGREDNYNYCETYPNENCKSIEELTMFKRITVIDQRNFYRRNGLPEKVEMRASFNKEALRKVGEKNPRPEWAERLLKPCRPCEPCENAKQFIKEQPRWPYRSSAARVFSDFQYEFY